MRRKGFLLKILLSIVCCGLLVFALFKLSSDFISNDKGVVVIQIIDQHQNMVSEKAIDFKEGDNLEKLIEDNFDGVLFANGMLMNAEGLETPSDYSYFFWIKVNGIDATVGLSDLDFKDKDVISLTFTKSEYENN